MAVAPVAACLGVTLRAARRAETSHPVPCTREVALRPLRPPSSRQQPLRMAAASEAVASAWQRTCSARERTAAIQAVHAMPPG